MISCRTKNISFMRNLLAAVCLILLSAASVFAAEPAGTVERAEGDFWAMREGKKVELSKNSGVFEFDILFTDKSGSATVRFKDNTVLEIRANTKIDVKEVVFTDTKNRFNVGVVNGTAKVKLYKGNAQVVARKSPNSLYDENLATYTSADTFDQDAAVGFIKLWGLPTKVYSEVQKNVE